MGNKLFGYDPGANLQSVSNWDMGS
jgi:hypothetical protein